MSATRPHHRVRRSPRRARYDIDSVQRVLLQMLDMEDLAAVELFARHVLPLAK